MQKYRNTVEFCVYGDKALFSDVVTRPGGEKFSYNIPTYEAIKGVLHSIYWKPTLTWYIDAVRIMKPIKLGRRGIRLLKYNGGSDLAYYTYLEDVCYQVRAHFEWNMNHPELEEDRNEGKHYAIAKQMIKSGGRRDVFLGTRECQAYVKPCIFGKGKGAYDNFSMDMPFMYEGLIYADEAEHPKDRGYMTKFFDTPSIKNGVIEFTRPSEIPQTCKQHVKKMDIKRFYETE